eukprot:TRINITY_DN18101_c0_g1_i2.p1 TRINITY_DN18101_c0_g1~~TRINITY_DN18101_c0_g1_i2.p1  ORF type:complete len:922 (-),score=259.79 TRINITY_DN18101_c0_g1_i2:188-2920(-)
MEPDDTSPKAVTEDGVKSGNQECQSSAISAADMSTTFDEVDLIADVLRNATEINEVKMESLGITERLTALLTDGTFDGAGKNGSVSDTATSGTAVGETSGLPKMHGPLGDAHKDAVRDTADESPKRQRPRAQDFINRELLNELSHEPDRGSESSPQCGGLDTPSLSRTSSPPVQPPPRPAAVLTARPQSNIFGNDADRGSNLEQLGFSVQQQEQRLAAQQAQHEAFIQQVWRPMEMMQQTPLAAMQNNAGSMSIPEFVPQSIEEGVRMAQMRAQYEVKLRQVTDEIVAAQSQLTQMDVQKAQAVAGVESERKELAEELQNLEQVMKDWGLTDEWDETAYDDKSWWEEEGWDKWDEKAWDPKAWDAWGVGGMSDAMSSGASGGFSHSKETKSSLDMKMQQLNALLQPGVSPPPPEQVMEKGGKNGKSYDAGLHDDGKGKSKGKDHGPPSSCGKGKLDWAQVLAASLNKGKGKEEEKGKGKGSGEKGYDLGPGKGKGGKPPPNGDSGHWNTKAPPWNPDASAPNWLNMLAGGDRNKKSSTSSREGKQADFDKAIVSTLREMFPQVSIRQQRDVAGDDDSDSGEEVPYLSRETKSKSTGKPPMSLPPPEDDDDFDFHSGDDYWSMRRVERAAERGFETRRRGRHWEFKISMGGKRGPPMTEVGMDRYCRWLQSRLKAFREENGHEALKGCRSAVDFSHNGMNNEMLWMLLDCLSRHELNAVLLKLFGNNISKAGMLSLCEFVRTSPEALQELHLSHNEVDDSSALELLRTLYSQKGKYPPRRLSEKDGEPIKTPVWLQMNQNNIVDPEAVLRRARAEGVSICEGRDRQACGTYRCGYRGQCPLVHLYNFAQQTIEKAPTPGQKEKNRKGEPQNSEKTGSGRSRDSRGANYWSSEDWGSAEWSGSSWQNGRWRS